MPIACLLFPRLGLQVALQQRAVPLGRPLALLSGHGDNALVAVASREASAEGVIAGMPAAQARAACREVAFLPDNAGACLDALDRIAAILRKRTTGDVAVGGRDHLLVALRAAESVNARRLLDLAVAWSGFEGRFGLGATIEEAVAAARRPRPAGSDDIAGAGAAVESLPRHEPLAAEVRSAAPMGQLSVRAALRRLVAGLGAVLETRGESFRLARLVVETAEGVHETRIRPGAAFHQPREVEDLLLRGLEEGDMAASSVRLELEDVGPDVRVVPCAASWAWQAFRRGALARAS